MTSTSDSGPQSTSTSDAGSPAAASAPGERIKTLVILGASGDLTGRLLLPGVAKLIASGRAPGLRLVGARPEEWPAQKWQDRLTESFADALTPGGVSTEDGIVELQNVQKDSTYHQIDVTAKGALGAFLKDVEGPVALYFALPPAVSQKACEILSKKDLPAGTRLVMEKP